MFKKILLAMPLVLVLALVAFVCTSAQGKVSLSDAQMSSVYGGYTCHVNETGDSACAGEWSSGDCSGLGQSPPEEGTCSRIRFTSCLQSEKYCHQDTFPDKGCIDDDDILCEGTYDTYECFVNPSNTCVEQSWGPARACYGRSPGSKSDAHDRW